MIVGAIVGSAFGNPLVGCVIGCGLASPVGILAETSIANALIDDPRVRGHIQEATVGRYIYETIRNMVAAGAAGFVASSLGEAIGPEIDVLMKGLMASLAKLGIAITEILLYAILKKYVSRALTSVQIDTNKMLTCRFRVLDLWEGKAVEEWDEAMKTFNDAKQRAEAGKPKPGDFPVEGHKYSIQIYGATTAFTCINGTEMRLRQYNGSSTQRFRCTSYDSHMGFICEGADNGNGRYLGYDSSETLACQAYYQRDWEHIDALAGSQGGYMLWMKKDSHFALVSKVTSDEVKMMATSSTRVSFVKMD
jgi:hypothetical protein